MTHEQIILEFSEKQQAFYFNQIRNGNPDAIPNSNGFIKVKLCESFDEALTLWKHLQNILFKENKHRTLKQVQFYANTVATHPN